MSLKAFEQFSKKYKNCRNLISGIVNSKKLNIKQAKALDFVAYEIVEKKISDPISLLKKAGFKTPVYKKVKTITLEKLSKLLDEFRDASPYELDGIVILDLSKPHVRNTKDNPDYSIAFKKPSGSAVTTVINVEWNISKHGVLVPRIHLEPVHLGGTTIQWAAGHNGKMVQANKLGPGAVVEVIRSGETIPKIIKIIKPAPKGAQMPTVPFHWSKTHVDLISDAQNLGQKQKVKQIKHFFKTLDAKGVSQKGIEKLVANGYDSVTKILHMTQTQLVANGLSKTFKGKRMHDILQVRNVELSRLMAATPFFEAGLGKRKMQPIVKKFGQEAILKGGVSMSELEKLGGFSKTNSYEISQGVT